MNLFRTFMELDSLEESLSRQELISRLRALGKNYRFDNYSDKQLFRMWQRAETTKPRLTQEPKHDLDLDFESRGYDYCDFCGKTLNELGQCPVCDLGEEDLHEGIYDTQPNRFGWVTASGTPASSSTISNVSNTTNKAITAQTGGPTQPTLNRNNKFVVRIVSHGGRLRALATDGVHPAAFVAFPNNLRQFEGQHYEVDQLIWNGKNYRVSGSITEI